MGKPALITIPTEPIGSLPRPAALAPLYEDAVRCTIERFKWLP